MSKVVLNEALKRQLPSMGETSTIEDENGNLLALIVPGDEYRRMMYSHLKEHYPYSKAELDQFRNEPGEYTLQEIMARLESL